MSQTVQDVVARILLESTHMGESYRDLIAWQKAMDLVTGIYGVTRSCPLLDKAELGKILNGLIASIKSAA
jgi:hypothetical protein